MSLVGKNLLASGGGTFPKQRSQSVYSPDSDFFEDSAYSKIEPVQWRRTAEHREVLYTVLSVVTGGLLALLSYRYNSLYVYVTQCPCSHLYAETVEVRIKMTSDKRVKTFFAKVERQMIDKEGVDGRSFTHIIFFLINVTCVHILFVISLLN